MTYRSTKLLNLLPPLFSLSLFMNEYGMVDP